MDPLTYLDRSVLIMEDKIKEAIILLRGNDYAVMKLSPSQIEDMDDCEAQNFEKDCTGCSCSCCVVE